MHIRIFQDGTYHLFFDMKAKYAIPFTDILKHCKGKYSKEYSLYRQFDEGKWERIGSISVRGLLMFSMADNPIWLSLRKQRGESYTWDDFVATRKKKLKLKKKETPK